VRHEQQNETRKVEEIEAESPVHLSYADTERYRFISTMVRKAKASSS